MLLVMLGNVAHAQTCGSSSFGGGGFSGITVVGAQGPGTFCAPVVVNWQMKFNATIPAGGNTKQIYIEWGDGTTSTFTAQLVGANLWGISGGNGAVTDNTIVANETAQKIYPAGLDVCELTANAYLRINGTNCLGSIKTEIVNYWDFDNQDPGDLDIDDGIVVGGVTTYRVCAGNSVTVNFTDNTQFNCVDPADTDNPNELARRVRFVYNTQNMGGTRIANVVVNGAVRGANYDPGISDTYPFPVENGDADFESLDILVPSTATNGQIYEVRLDNWGPCNPYNGGAGTPVSEYAIIQVVNSINATFDIRLNNGSGTQQTTFCPGSNIHFDADNITGGATGAAYRYRWEIYDGPTDGSALAFRSPNNASGFNSGDNFTQTGAFPSSTGTKLVRLYIKDNNDASGSCTIVKETTINITTSPIARILTDGADVAGPIHICETAADLTYVFTDGSTSKNATTRTTWDIKKNGVTVGGFGFPLIQNNSNALFSPAAVSGGFNFGPHGPGTYVVSLKTEDTGTGCGQTPDAITIHVYDQPVAGFTANEVCQGNNTSFSNASSLPTVVNGDAISKWEWDFSYDGITFNIERTDNSTPSFTRNLGNAGTYTVALRVTTDPAKGGCVSTVFTDDVVVKHNPTATFTSNFVNGTLCPGGQVTFTNTSNETGVDASAKPVTYHLGVKQGAGAEVFVSFPNPTLLRSFANATAGSLVYVVRLRATAANGCQVFSPTQNITVNPGSPSNFNTVYTLDNSTYNSFADNCSPQELRFTADASTTALSPTDYTWTIRDGAVTLHSVTSASNTLTYNFENDFPTIVAKTYTVELQPLKNGVCISPVTNNIKIAPKPSSAFSISVVSEDCDEVVYRLESTQKGLVVYDWDFDPLPFSFIPGSVTSDDNIIEVTYQRPLAAATNITPEFSLITTNNLNCVSDETAQNAPVLVKRDDVVPVILTAVSPVPVANPSNAAQQLVNSCAPTQIVSFANNTVQASLPGATSYQLFITKNGGTPFQATAPKLTGDLTFKVGNFNYEFDEVGVYEVELRAILPSTCTPFSTPPVLVRVYPKPVADFDLFTTTNCGSVSVTLDDNSSLTNPGGSLPVSALATRTWSIRDVTHNALVPGSPFATANSTAFSNANTLLTNLNNTNDDFIDYEITMSVITNQGCESDDVVKTVRVYKQADVGISVVSPNPACEGDYEFEFDIDPKNNPVGTEYSINFGDGGAATAFSTSVANVSHTYTNPLGFNNQYQYTAEITARTPDNCTAKATTVVTLRPRLRANFVVDKSQGCSPLAVNFSNVSLGANLTHTWSYRKVGDAGFTAFTSPNAVNPQQVFTNATAAAIDYEVRLVIVNTATCTDDTLAATPIKVFPSYSTPAMVNTNNAVCAGQSGVAYSIASPNAGSQYNWTVVPAAASSAGGFVVSGQLTSSITVDFLSQAGGVVVTATETNANGCVGTPRVKNVTVRPLPTASISGTTAICFGQSTNLTFNLGGSPGPYNVVYNDGNANIPLNGISNGHFIAVNPASTTSYTLVSVTDVNTLCANTNLGGSALITVKPLPTATISGTNTVCSGQSSNLVFNFGGNGPWSYVYTDGVNPPINAVSNQSTAIVTINNITSTRTYSLVSVTDNVSCSQAAVGSATITVNPLPSAVISSAQTSVCLNSAPSLRIKFNSGVGPYTVRYRANGGPLISLFNVTPQDLVNNIYTFSPASIGIPTTYTLAEVIDSNNPSCGTTNAALLTGSPTVNIDALPLGELSANANFTPRTSSATICYNGSQQIHFKLTGKAANPQFDVVYTDGTSNFALNNILSGHFVTINNITSNKTYSIVSILDHSSGCQNNSVVTPPLQVNVRTLPTATIVGTTSICQGSSTNLVFTATGTAPFEVDYSDGISTTTLSMPTNSRTIAVNPATNRTYSIVAVRDGISSSLSCSNTTVVSSAIVTVFPNYTSDAIINANTSVCSGQNNVAYSIGAPNASSSYQWSISPTSAGSIASGQGTSSITINYQNQANAVVLSVIETDFNGCQGSPSTRNVTVQPLPTATISGTTAICFNGNANLSFTASGGTGPYQVEYADGTGINKFVIVQPGVTAIVPKNNLTATTNYTLVAVTDQTTTCSRSVSGSALITVRPLPTATISGNTTICHGQTTNVVLNLGGNGPWQVKMSKGAVDTVINNIGSSTFLVPVSPNTTTVYTLTEVTDVNNCVRTGLTDFVTVNVNPLPSAVISGTQSICINTAPTLNIEFNAGLAPFTVTYSANGVNNTLFNVVPDVNGDFSFTPASISAQTTYALVSVGDSNNPNCGTSSGALLTGSAVVSVTDLPTATLSLTSGVVTPSTTVCSGDSQELHFTMTGTGPFDVVYTDGTTVFPTLVGINSGHVVLRTNLTSTKSFTIVSVKDALGCQRNNVNSSVNINVRALPSINISGTTTICVGSSTNLVFSVSGSSPMSFEYLEGAVLRSDTILLGNISRTVSVSPSATTTYTLVSVTDQFGCHSVPANGSATVTVIPTFASGGITNGNASVCARQSSVAYQIVPAQILATSEGYVWTLTPASSGTIVSGQGTSQILVDFSAQVGNVTLSAVETRDFGGGVKCLGTPSTHQIIVNQLPTGTLTGSVDICRGESTLLTFNLTGASPFNVVYAIDNVAQAPLNGILNGHQIQVSPNNPTNYTLVSIEDSNSPTCQVNNVNSSAFVNVRSLPTLSVSGTRTICRGESTNLIFNLGGTGPWSFTYTDGNSNFDVLNVSSSSHPVPVSPANTSVYSLVSVTDGNGCQNFNSPTTLTATATITVNDLPSALISTVTDTICAGSVPTLQIEFLTGQEPFRVRYIDNNNLIYTLVDVNPDPVTHIFTFNPQAITQSTSYTLFDVRDANNPNCFSNQNSGNLLGQADVVVNDLPIVALSTDAVSIDTDATICFGEIQRLYFHIDGAGPFDVSYKEGNNTIQLSGISDGHFIEVSPADNLQYEITAVSDNNNPVCNALQFGDQVTVFVNQLPTGIMSAEVSAICDGLGTELIFDFTGTSPWTFTFTDGTNDSTKVSNNARFEVSISPDVPTTYTLLTVEDGNGCIINPNQSVDIGINALPHARLGGDDEYCQGDEVFIDIKLTGVGPWQVSYTNQTTIFNTEIFPDALYTPNVDTLLQEIRVFPGLGSTQYDLVNVVDLGTGCISPLTSPGGTDVVVFDLPVASISANSPVCVGSQTTLSFDITGGLAPYDVVISRTDGLPNIVLNNIPGDHTLPVTLTQNTTFTLVSVIDSRASGSAQGCAATNLGQPITVVANPLPTAHLEGSRILCYGDVAVLTVTSTGNGPFTIVYRRTDANGVQDVMVSNIGTTREIEVTPLIDAEYTLVSIVDSNNPQCTGTVSGNAEISVYPELAPNFEVRDAGGNLTTTLTLPLRRFFFTNTTPTPGAWDYVWDFGDGETLATPDATPVNHEYDTYGTYQVSLTASNADCEETFSVDVTIAPVKPIAQFSYTPDNGCLPVEVQFTNESQFADPTRYRWEFGDGSISTAINPRHTYTVPGLYTVTLSATNPSEEIDREVKVQIIEIFAVPNAGFAVAPLEVFLPDQPIYTRNDSQNATTFDWDFGDGQTSTDYEPIHLYEEEGIYDITLVAINDLGCTDTLTMTAAVIAKNGGQIKIPNVFTPGASSGSGGSGGLGFGDNKFFLPITDGVVAFELLIYNRWGELIFESTDRNKGWDGYYKGQLCPQDVYVYRLKATLESGEVLTKIGDVTLLR